MKAFISNTISIGPGIYLLIPAEEARAQGIKEGEYFSVELQPLAPKQEVTDDPRD